MNEIIRDGGYKSRKLAFCFFAVVVMFIGACVACKCAGFASIYSTFVGGVMGVVALLLTGNVATKFVGLKAPQDPVPPPKEPILPLEDPK